MKETWRDKGDMDDKGDTEARINERGKSVK
jgi:hypothetical protein